MSDTVKIGFVIDGTEFTIDQLKEMAEAAKEVGEETEEANKKVEKSSKSANKQVGLIGKSFTGLKNLAKGLKTDFMNGFTAVKMFAQGLGLSAKASRGLAVGLSALGLPIILMLLAAVIEFFKNFEAGIKIVTTVTNILGNVIANVTEALTKLAKLDFGGFFKTLGKTGKVIGDTVKDTNALFKAERDLSEMNQRLATENAILQATFDKQSDIIRDTTKSFEERKAAMEAMNAAEEQLMANAVAVAKLEKERLQRQINLENNAIKQRKLKEELAQVEAGLITQQAAFDRQRQRSASRITKLEQDRLKEVEEAAKKELDIRKKFFDSLTSLEQKNELARISDQRERDERRLELERQNQIRSIRQSEFSEGQKARLITQINEDFRLSLKALDDQANENEEQRVAEHQARLLQIRNEIGILEESDTRKRRELQLQQQELAALKEIENLEDAEEIKLEIERKFQLQRQALRDEFRKVDEEQASADVLKAAKFAEEEFTAIANVTIAERQKQLLEATSFFDGLLAAEELTTEDRIKLEEQRAAVIKGIDDDIRASQAAAIGSVSNTIGAIGSILAEGSAEAKAFAILDAIINTYKSANLALASAPPPFGAILAASNVAAGIANINKIKSSTVGDTSANVNVPSTSSFTGLADAASGRTLTRLEQEDGELVPDREQQPIKAFVIAQDVTDNQAANKKIRDLSRL
jgi:hypothetical protein